MPYIAIPFILVAVLTIAWTARITYVIKDDSRRQSLLSKQKAKYGQQAYDIYNRVYTRKFLLASTLISLSWVVYVLKNLIELSVGHITIVTYVSGFIALAAGVIGAFLASRVLKGEK